MPKTLAELQNSKGGETAESNGMGAAERPLRPAGVYQLKNDAGEVVDTVIVKVHPKFGDSQAAAAERVGYRFLREARKDEIKEIEVDAKYLATENQLGGITADENMKGVMARLSALEKENADLRAAQGAETTKGASDNVVAADSKEHAKDSAIEQTEQRLEQGNTDKPAGDEPMVDANALPTEDEEKSDDAPADSELKAAKDETPGKGAAPANTNTNTKKEGK